jgi:hypothetical protein
MADVRDILDELRLERDAVNDTIIVLQRLAAAGGRRRVRPRKSMTAVTAIDAPMRRGRPRSTGVNVRAAGGA